MFVSLGRPPPTDDQKYISLRSPRIPNLILKLGTNLPCIANNCSDPDCTNRSPPCNSSTGDPNSTYLLVQEQGLVLVQALGQVLDLVLVLGLAMALDLRLR